MSLLSRTKEGRVYKLVVHRLLYKEALVIAANLDLAGLESFTTIETPEDLERHEELTKR